MHEVRLPAQIVVSLFGLQAHVFIVQIMLIADFAAESTKTDRKYICDRVLIEDSSSATESGVERQRTMAAEHLQGQLVIADRATHCTLFGEPSNPQEQQSRSGVLELVARAHCCYQRLRFYTRYHLSIHSTRRWFEFYPPRSAHSGLAKNLHTRCQAVSGKRTRTSSELQSETKTCFCLLYTTAPDVLTQRIASTRPSPLRTATYELASGYIRGKNFSLSRAPETQICADAIYRCTADLSVPQPPLHT
jgi:hypothetical protein